MKMISLSRYDVKAYPSVVYGWQYGYAYSGLGLPTRIWNNYDVPTYQSFSLYGSQNEDVLIDNWLLSSPSASKQSDEVEIFVSNDIGAYSNGNLGGITLDNTYYQVSSRLGGSWNVYNFIPNQGSTNSPNRQILRTTSMHCATTTASSPTAVFTSVECRSASRCTTAAVASPSTRQPFQ